MSLHSFLLLSLPSGLGQVFLAPGVVAQSPVSYWLRLGFISGLEGCRCSFNQSRHSVLDCLRLLSACGSDYSDTCAHNDSHTVSVVSLVTLPWALHATCTSSFHSFALLPFYLRGGRGKALNSATILCQNNKTRCKRPSIVLRFCPKLVS